MKVRSELFGADASAWLVLAFPLPTEGARELEHRQAARPFPLRRIHHILRLSVLRLLVDVRLVTRRDGVAAAGGTRLGEEREAGAVAAEARVRAQGAEGRIFRGRRE